MLEPLQQCTDSLDSIFEFGQGFLPRAIGEDARTILAGALKILKELPTPRHKGVGIDPGPGRDGQGEEHSRDGGVDAGFEHRGQ